MLSPDSSRLEALPRERMIALADRLAAIGLNLESVNRLDGEVLSIAPWLRRPLRLWQLRRSAEPIVVVMRALMFDDPVEESALESALGAPLVAGLLADGVLERRNGGIVSPLVLNLVDDLMLFTDRLALGGDAVMGAGATTFALCAAAVPKARVRTALDLGCGAGTVAALLSRSADEVLAADVNPRALALTRANLALNRIGNVQLARGDWFDAVSDRTFDRIACQPPFVAGPSSSAASTFLHGGRRGDEIALQLLAQVDRHLAADGLATFFIEWPELDGDDFVARARAATAPGNRLLVLRAPQVGLLSHCSQYAANEHPELGEAYERRAIEIRQHLEEVGVRGLRPTLVVVAKGGARPWTHVVDVPPFAQLRPTGVRVAKLIAARDLLEHDDQEAILDVRLRFPKRTAVVEERSEPSASAPRTLSVRPPPNALSPGATMTEQHFQMLSLVHEAATPAAAIGLLVRDAGAPPKLARQQVLAVVRKALEGGLLQVDEA